MDKSINTYLNNSLCKTYMKNNLEVFLYKGDYHTIYKAKKIIIDSNIKESYKEEVIEFIKYISNNGVTKAQEQYSNTNSKFILLKKYAIRYLANAKKSSEVASLTTVNSNKRYVENILKTQFILNIIIPSMKRRDIK